MKYKKMNIIHSFIHVYYAIIVEYTHTQMQPLKEQKKNKTKNK